MQSSHLSAAPGTAAPGSGRTMRGMTATDALLLVALAMGPGMILLHGVYVADRYAKEPVKNLLRYLIAGAAVAVPAALVEIGCLRILGIEALDDPALSWVALSVVAFLVVALVEELGKRLMLHVCARKDPHVDEPFDWIVYSVAIALGFATIENVVYVLEGGAAVALARAFTAVPAHALNATLMGDRLARAEREEGARATRQRALAVLEPTAWHGAYDLIAFGGARAVSGSDGAGLAALPFWGALATLLVAQWWIALRRVHAQQIASEESHFALPRWMRVPRLPLTRRRGRRAEPAERGREVEGGDQDAAPSG